MARRSRRQPRPSHSVTQSERTSTSRRSERSSVARVRHAVEGSAITAEMQERLRTSLELLQNAPPTVVEHHKDVPPPERYYLEPCTPIALRIGPQYQFTYRLPFELATPCILSSANSNSIGLACVTILDGRVSFAADLRFNQTWDYRGIGYRDISSSIALAPGEHLTLTVRKTQRTQLTQSTMDSTDSLQSSESTVVDKDVLNVTRSTSQTQQWRVDGNANFSLGEVFHVGVGGGLSGSVQSSSNSVVEHISEAPQKSVNRLQTLQKIEVARQSEATMEDAQSRTIINPYRDRALTLNIYELSKGFAITTELAEVRPSLILEITDLDLDRNFVLTQGDFLDRVLLDRNLNAELRDALQTANSPISTTNTELSRRYARLAFYYLFEEPNVFNIDAPVRTLDSNLPWSSFADYEGLNDAKDNDASRIFTTLGTYFRAQASIYNSALPPWRGPSDHGHDLEVPMAVALADSIKDDWIALPLSNVRNLMDHDNPTEIMRRVSGFISLVDNLLRPIMKPAQDEAAAAAAAGRAENVFERVHAHLQCNKAFYVQQFLEDLWRQTRGYAFSDVLSRILDVPGMPLAQLFKLFNPRAGFIDGFQFVVPLFWGISTADAIEWIKQISGVDVRGVGEEFRSTTDELIVPCDGFHLEPVPGTCVLPDVPVPSSSVKAAINVDATAPA
jgi:hypothetical protein